MRRRPAVKTWETPVCALGEGPVWDAHRAQLFWTDIHGCQLHALMPETAALRSWDMPQRLCSFAMLAGSDRLIGAFETGFARICLDRPEAPDWLETPYALGSGVRFNDGKTDPKGRFLAGAMDDACRDRLGGLWRLEEDLSAQQLLSDICISNSLAWSPDGHHMYFCDTPRRLIWVFTYDVDTGALGPARPHCDVSEIPGAPDGSAVDIHGNLWTAFYGGACVARISAAGHIEEVIEMPVDQPTCCAFGGADGQTLFVTTAAETLGPEVLRDKPSSGKLLSFDAGVKGLIPPRAIYPVG